MSNISDNGALSFLAGQESKLVKLHEHTLSRTSSNFTYGSFGGGGGSDGGPSYGGPPYGDSKSDSVCVQSMDGTLTFLNADQAGFECFIPGFLVPGPLCYMQGPDSIVTCSASCKVEAYRYITLAAATVKGKSEAHDDHDADEDGEAAGKRVQVDWSTNIGEHALEIKYCNSTPRSIVVLGERTIFWLSENGTITYGDTNAPPPPPSLSPSLQDTGGVHRPPYMVGFRAPQQVLSLVWGRTIN